MHRRNATTRGTSEGFLLLQRVEDEDEVSKVTLVHGTVYGCACPSTSIMGLSVDTFALSAQLRQNRDGVAHCERHGLALDVGEDPALPHGFLAKNTRGTHL